MADDAVSQLRFDVVFRVWDPVAARAAAAELPADEPSRQAGDEDYLVAAALIQEAVLSLVGRLADQGIEVREVGVDYVHDE